MTDWTERFRADLTALVGLPSGPIAVAVSGGPDSMALLSLAHATAPTIAATVDHRLRAASAAEARMVADWCAAAGVPHTTLVPPDGWAPQSIQADARVLRYALLTDWAKTNGATVLLTAHHADDQAETFLMRAGRGSGVTGLGGIRALRDERGVTLARPLLGWRRAELRAFAEAQGLPFVDDPSNADPRFDRVRMRDWLSDAPIEARAVAQSAAACAEAAAALDAMADLMVTERRRGDGWDMTGLPREVRRRLARRAILDVRTARPCEGRFDPATNVEGLLDALYAGEKATIAGVLACSQGQIWHFRPAPPRRSDRV
ncbi:tRNA lysidine(34) synthetase TilS [Sphingomonas sp. Leaf33]|uniref:tRNA lysidine(34) synthetase TilS n=1 Tax=Sphingomonas sp. Leaf33 TaxID=1736215 RepID=UPI000A67CD71|nr:tRNA lysidine(34) synthetase TilS [Sphingomonas sp. Leaf33]